MPYQSPYIAIFRRGHPQPGKIILQHELQDVLGIPMGQPPLAVFVRSGIRPRDLLHARVIIAAYAKWLK